MLKLRQENIENISNNPMHLIEIDEQIKHGESTIKIKTMPKYNMH